MKAAVVTAPNEKWRIQEVPTPKPGPNQVLIRIRASGICFTDVHQTKGELTGPFPRVLGHEPAGEIAAVGAGVRTRRVGDRVGVAWVMSTCGRCEWCLRGRENFCPELVGTGGQTNGGHAEFLLAEGDATFLLPDGISFEQAAPIFCAGYTVYSGLRIAQPQPHERVAVVGIGNSNDAMTDSVQGLRPDGRLVLMGFESKPLVFSPGDFIMKRMRVLGSQQNGTEYLYEALDYVAKGKVRVIEETYKLDDITRAYGRVAEGKVRFRAVVVN